MRNHLLFVAVLVASVLPGCALKEIRSKSKIGPEFRHRGSNSTSSVRWLVQQGFDFKWDEGVSTGITYRRRDTDGGSGDNDNGVWIDFSFPIWKAPIKEDATAARVEEVERRLAQLEGQAAARFAQRDTEPRTGGQ